MSSEKELKDYSLAHRILKKIFLFFYRAKFVGQENIPEGPCVVCGNHSSWVDPFLIAFSLDRNDILHMMAKAELFKNRIVAFFMRKFAAFPINRSISDVESVKTAIRYLKSGEKIGIFPEGTRAANDGDVEAKIGAVKIAEITKTPLLPVYVPRKKSLFKRFSVVIGEPYPIQRSKDRSNERYNALSAELMERISGLKSGED